MLHLRLALAALTGLASCSAMAAIDTRFAKNSTFIAANNMLRQEYLSQFGSACGNEDPGKLVNRVPFYVYMPATSATAVTAGKYAAVVFLHGKNEQGDKTVPNMCWNHSTSVYSELSSTLNLVEVQAGGPGAAIKNGTFTPSQKMIVIIPQSKLQGGFSVDAIRRVVEDASNQLALQGIELDANRVYLTGLSLGGGSVLNYVLANPKHFAAIAPIEAASSINSCFLENNHIPTWGFAGTATGNMFSAALKEIINGTSACPRTPTQYTNPAYTCVTADGKSCTLLSSATPADIRATFMPTDGHSGWTQVYNSTHPALPTTEKNIYNWMLAHNNTAQGNPVFPVQYVNPPVTPPNLAPKFNPVVDIQVNSGNVAETSLLATDDNVGDVISLHVKGTLPSFLTFTDQGNGAGKLVASPTASQASTLVAVEIEAVDTAGAKASVIVNVEVIAPSIPQPIDLTNATILPGAVGNPSALIDEQNKAAPTNSWFPGWQATYPVDATIDLGREYTISEISLYDANSSGKFEVYDGDAAHGQPLLVTDLLGSYNVWNKYPVNVKTRYLKMKKYNGANMGEILIKGY